MDYEPKSSLYGVVEQCIGDQVAQLFDNRSPATTRAYINSAGLGLFPFIMSGKNVLLHPTLFADRFLAEFSGHIEC